jgi:hypothetical protein
MVIKGIEPSRRLAFRHLHTIEFSRIGPLKTGTRDWSNDLRFSDLRLVRSVVPLLEQGFRESVK